MKNDIDSLIAYIIKEQASDLHLIAGCVPTMRVHGLLYPIPGAGVLTSEDIQESLKKIMRPEQYESLSVNKELDFSFVYSDQARFRANCYTQKGSTAAAFRLIPLELPDLYNLKLPPIVNSFTNLRQGLVLVTGPTGHGKSTTLAAILNEINKNKACHIVTIEDPIEFIFKPIKSIISQREMKSDTHSWNIALKSVLREDPDIVLIGEMRDYETIASALTIAETGHLVFATLHTNSAAQTVDRIVDVFPQDQQSQVRLQLSMVLEAIFSQRLVNSTNNQRVVAYEVALATTAIKTTIREAKTHQIDSIIQTSFDVGMSTLERSLSQLVKDGTISVETAQSWSEKPEELNRLIRETN